MPMPDGGYEFASGDVRGMRAMRKLREGLIAFQGKMLVRRLASSCAED